MPQQQSPANASLNQRLNIEFALEAAGLGVWELDPSTNVVHWDDTCRALFGLARDNNLPYEKAIQYIHPQDLDRVNQAVQQAMSPHADGHYDITYRTVGADDQQLRWVRFSGRAYFTPQGQVYRFAGTAQDVTQQVLTRHQLEASEAKLRSLIQAAPAGIGLFMGRDLVIQMPNQTFIDIVGKGPGVEGLPLREAMPELLTEGQPFLAILDEVFTTGVPFISPASLVKVVQNGVLRANYYNISYVPIRDQSQTVYAILDIAIDVTEQIKAQQALKESQAIMEAMIDVAELGTYTIHVATNQLIKSPRVAAWYGLPEITDVATSISRIRPNDQERVSLVFARALEPGSSGTYQVEYVVDNLPANQAYKLQTVGQVRWGVDGLPTHVDGLVRDITLQHEQQLALEGQVQQRTKELATANEALSSSNEEYVVINEELAESNGLLVRSNDNLQTFAYVASHDLQEPLRKIQQFGDLLKTRFADSLPSEAVTYIGRMQTASNHMSKLIKDLLSFSSISTQRNRDKPVDLNQVLDQVLSVLDLRLVETATQVEVDLLPTVLGDEAQLGQLFQNLIGNAIKFHQPGITPLIRISSHLVAIDQLPSSIKPARQSPIYYRLEVADNGIGFDEKYLDRIFQVFQRLHGKNAFAGTGIGLAICEKVVSNHGGVITASSQLGQGATFFIYLPA